MGIYNDSTYIPLYHYNSQNSISLLEESAWIHHIFTKHLLYKKKSNLDVMDIAFKKHVWKSRGAVVSLLPFPTPMVVLGLNYASHVTDSQPGICTLMLKSRFLKAHITYEFIS